MDAREALLFYFGYSEFREGQERLIDALLSGRDALGIMPTGGGKSLCYQIPALMLPGLALVVSPLISLMQDQVSALREAGVPAVFINSTLSSEEARAAYASIRAGEHKIVYITPERLSMDGFRKLAAGLEISLLAVDEAHCISQWGQDFRPSYLKILDFVKFLPKRPPLAAFTATATAEVREDIERILELRDPVRVITGFDRPNLFFRVLRPEKKERELLRLLAEHRDESGIIYCSTRKTVEKLCERLRERGISATRYHAGLDEAERRDNQTDFVYDRSRIMVATNAFGMGIDKSNVRFVIHYNMPKSPEAYYQEAGRAGRDGERADCTLLFSPSDVVTARFLIETDSENTELTDEQRENVILMDLRRLKAMEGYCKTGGCLRCYLLDYFGQANPGRCGFCGGCLRRGEEADITLEAQMILSCVKRIEAKLGYSVGRGLVADTLCGSENRRVKELGLDSLSTYGLMRGVKRERVSSFFDRLEELGYLRTEEPYRTLRLGEGAGDVLFRGRSVAMWIETAEPAPKVTKKRGKAAKKPKIEAESDRGDIFERLRALRREIADREGVPAFVIFSDATLRAMAEALPTDEEAMLGVSGVGKFKLEKYGEAFIETIKEAISDGI